MPDSDARKNAHSVALTIADSVESLDGSSLRVHIGGDQFDVPPEVVELIARSSADNTVLAYRSDWKLWQDWCAANLRDPIPADPAAVAEWIAECSKRHKTSTIVRRLAALARAHLVAGLPSPTTSPVVRLTVEGLRRSKPSRLKQAKPIRLDMLRDMLAENWKVTSSATGYHRDHAVMTLGWWTALRRSNIVGLDFCDVEVSGSGDSYIVHVGSTKTELDGHTQGIFRPEDSRVDPVAAMTAWLAELSWAGHSDMTSPLFRQVHRSGSIGHGRLDASAVTRIVKRLVAELGENPEDYSAHSLRAGFVTESREQGIPDHVIMERSRHSDSRMLDTYTRVSDAERIGRRLSEGLSTNPSHNLTGGAPGNPRSGERF